MAAMDTDQSGAIQFAEFEVWWRGNSGDLERHRELAFSVDVGESGQLILVAGDTAAKEQWVGGLRAVLLSHLRVRFHIIGNARI